MKRRPTLLVVLDGWGHREERESNAILERGLGFQELLGRYPHTLLSASGREVGLPLGLMGNSEVGHLNLGAGRVVYQDVTRIDKAIEDGEFAANGTINAALEAVRKSGKRLHLCGLVSDGGVHSSDGHLRALLRLAADRGLAPEQVLVHAILDGRDTPPRSGDRFIEVLEKDIAAAGVGRIATVIGRYWAMDRDQRWERTERAHELYVLGNGTRVERAIDAVRASYAADVGDEFVEPFVVGSSDASRMQDGDALFLFNYRADRMRQLATALGFADFDGFARKRRPELAISTMTQYRADFPFPVAFPKRELKGVFSEVVAAHGLTQKRIAETEKYAHVTYFFSGGSEEPEVGEERILVPSPKVATYDLQPEMSAPIVTDKIMQALERDETDVYVINFANADMVGHTGIWSAALAAVEAVDQCLQRIVPEVVRRGGLVAITADHGNSEQLWDAEHDQPHTAHTTNPVPIVLCSADLLGARLRPIGTLADVAPTLLELMGVPKPDEMDGLSLMVR